MDVQLLPDGSGPADGEGRANAEVEEVWPRDGWIRLIGAVPDDSADAPAELVARRRGGDGLETRVAVALRGGRFDARLVVADLASACSAKEQTWDLYLARPGREEVLRLGRHLDDVRSKKKVFTYPAQSSGSVSVKPYYTIKDNLSITCRREGV